MPRSTSTKVRKSAGRGAAAKSTRAARGVNAARTNGSPRKAVEAKGTLPPVDERRALDLVMRLIEIPGRSGQEGRVAEFVVARLRDAGVPAAAIRFDTAHRKSVLKGEVGNLIVKLPGTVRGPRRLMMAHLDTVPLCVGAKPVRRGASIVSRDPSTALGGDDRSGVAVALHAALEILRLGLPHPPLTLFFPVQEEIGLCGARHVSVPLLGRPALCFNWDGGSPEVVTVGATGAVAMEIAVQGIASHAGAHPELGVSAVAIASLAVGQLVVEGWHGLIERPEGIGTSNVGVVHGGEATNVVTPLVNVRAEARSHDPVFRRKIVEAFRGAFDRAVARLATADGRRGGVRFEVEDRYESFRLEETEPCVQAAAAAVRAAGLDPLLRTSNGGLDANWLTAHGLPTVTLGTGQREIHTTNESLEVADFLAACRIGLRLATGLPSGTEA